MAYLVLSCLLFLAPACVKPEIWPPDGRLSPNNYVPPTTTSISLPVYKEEERQSCVTTNRTVCRTEVRTEYNSQFDESCMERLRDERNRLEEERRRREEEERNKRLKELKDKCAKIQYRNGHHDHIQEKCEYDYLAQCKPIYQTKYREKCEDKYESKCEESYQVKMKRECGYETNEVGPICKDIPVRRPIKKCSRQPRRVCSQVPLPTTHKCEPPRLRCIQVPVETVEEECLQGLQNGSLDDVGGYGGYGNLTYAVASANLNDDQCLVRKPEEKEEVVCEEQPQVTCKKTKVRVPIYPFPTSTAPPPTSTSQASYEPSEAVLEVASEDAALDDLEFQVYQTK